MNAWVNLLSFAVGSFMAIECFELSLIYSGNVFLTFLHYIGLFMALMGILGAWVNVKQCLNTVTNQESNQKNKEGNKQ